MQFYVRQVNLLAIVGNQHWRLRRWKKYWVKQLLLRKTCWNSQLKVAWQLVEIDVDKVLDKRELQCTW